jgi:hypothetical protein
MLYTWKTIYHYLSMVHLQRLTTYPKLWVLPGCKISTIHGWCKVLDQSGLRTCRSTLILSHWLTRELMDRLLKWSEVDEVDVRLVRTGVGSQHSHPRLSTWSYLSWGYSQLLSDFLGTAGIKFSDKPIFKKERNQWLQPKVSLQIAVMLVKQ